MNRPLKFRIYSPLNKAFHHFTVEESIAGGASKPQQYTGLKDKNNNPIYEGDIVKWDNLNYLVEWNDIAYKWQGRCPYYHSYHHPTTEHFRDLMNGVIVGNYFENNELLK